MKDKQYVVICVDDEPNILKTLERILKLDGYLVITALSGLQALELLEQNKDIVDLLVADQRMPEMSGSELLSVVRAKYPNVMRVMLSGYSDFPGLVQAVNEGEIFRFVAKPWDNDELREVIKFALEQKQVTEIVEVLIKELKALPQLTEGVVVEASVEKNCVNIKIDKKNVVSPEAIAKILNFVFTSFGVDKEEKIKVVSGVISKAKGKVNLSIDLNKGMILNIELPGDQEI